MAYIIDFTVVSGGRYYWRTVTNGVDQKLYLDPGNLKSAPFTSLSRATKCFVGILQKIDCVIIEPRCIDICHAEAGIISPGELGKYHSFWCHGPWRHQYIGSNIYIIIITDFVG